MSEETNVVTDEFTELETMQETETPTEEAEVTNEGTDQPDPIAEWVKGIEAKVDGKDVRYESVDDLLRDARRGHTVDRLIEQRDKYKNDPAYQYMQQRMKASGYTNSEEFVKELMISEKVEELVKDGMTEDKARQYAKDMVKMPSYDAKSQELSNFLQWHEGKVKAGVLNESIDPENIPQEVLDAYDQGESLKEAYQDYLLKNIKSKTEQETLQKVANNGEKSGKAIPEGQPQKTEMTKAQVNKLMQSMTEREQDAWADANMDMLERIKYYE